MRVSSKQCSRSRSCRRTSNALRATPMRVSRASSLHDWTWLQQRVAERLRVETYAVVGEGGFGKTTLSFALTSNLIQAGYAALLLQPTDFDECRNQ